MNEDAMSKFPGSEWQRKKQRFRAWRGDLGTPTSKATGDVGLHLQGILALKSSSSLTYQIQSFRRHKSKHPIDFIHWQRHWRVKFRQDGIRY